MGGTRLIPHVFLVRNFGNSKGSRECSTVVSFHMELPMIHIRRIDGRENALLVLCQIAAWT